MKPFRILIPPLFALLAVCSISVRAAVFTPPTSNRVAIDFNADWLYVQGDVTGAQAQSFVDTSWTSVGLPHTTKFVSPENPTAYIGVSWYRKHFTVSSAYQGRKIFIQFGAAMQTAKVYVNGTLLTQHNGGYTPFTVDVTSNVNYGGADNVIAVRLDSTPNSNWAPGNSDPDFQYHGGLYRDVTMLVTDKLHITDPVYAAKVAAGGIFVTYPSVSTSSATVSAQTDVLNENGSSESVTVVSTLTDANGNIVQTATTTVSVPAGGDQIFTQNLVVASPNLWHPYTPYLYTLNTQVEEGSTTVDYLTTNVGIRTIQWTNANGFLINGAPFKAMGANFHQDIYGLGNAMPDKSIYDDVLRLKNAGFDFVRTCHYPHSPAFYDACDKLGVLVMEPIPGWQFYPDTSTFDSATFKDCQDMIRRDRNHPSIVLWETSLNESSYTNAWATSIQAIAHAEYPGNQMFTSGWITTLFDTLCSSEQAGVRSSTDPRPIIIDEYGDWSYGGNSSTSRVAREGPDSALLVQCGNFELSRSENLACSWFSADALWVFADYTGYLTSTTKCGVMDTYRLPKFSYYFFQSQRDPTVSIPNVTTGPMVYIANTWQTTSPTSVVVFSNCQQVSLYVNGALVATQSPDTTYSNLNHPPFTFNLATHTPGTIKAVGLIGGVAAASYSRTTPGTPTQITLTPERTDALAADGGDSREVFISVLDGNGNVVPTSTNQINLSVSGAGNIIGPTSVTMKGGELATWVQAGRVAGNITLTATGAGLTSASVTLSTQAVPNLGPPPAPSVPIGLTATAQNNSITLNWTAASGAWSYNVERSQTSGGPYTTIANTSGTTYTDTSITSGMTYYYVVSAVNEANVASANSAQVSISSGLLINPSFEYNTSGATFTVKVNAGYDVPGNDVAGWLDAGTTYNDSGVDFAGDNGNIAENGTVVAYCDSGDSGAYQITGYQVQTGDQISLTWWAKSSYKHGTQVVQLLKAPSTSSAYSASTSLASSTAALNNTGDSGAFTQYTLNYTASAADAGQYLAVSFKAGGINPGSYATFDNFGLTITSIPSAPLGLTASAGNGQVLLSWNPVSNATGYNVKQVTASGGSPTTIASNIATTSYTNTGLTNGTTYYYVVSALNQAGEGANSAVVSVEPVPPAPAAPTNLTVVQGNGLATLTWDASATATSYNIVRSLIPGGFDTVVATNVTALSYTDTGLTNGTTYYYSVVAVNLGGDSNYSTQISVEPLSPSTTDTPTMPIWGLIVTAILLFFFGIRRKAGLLE
jgi:fibronectin type 3 domain-containing protein